MSKAAILSTGTEILQGLYADTNAQWLSSELSAMGIDVVYHMAAPDSADAMAGALSILLETSDLVLMTGGLGPTDDDLSRQAIASVFQCELREDEEAWRRICERFSRRGGQPPRSNRVQCLIPQSARVLQNDWGTAPGFIIETDHGCLATLPGPPREMRPMFENCLKAHIAETYGGGRCARTRTLHTFGISESLLNDCLQSLFEEWRQDPQRKIALLAGQARVDVRLTAYGQSPREVTQWLANMARRVKRRIPEGYIYGSGDDTLESVVQERMLSRDLTLALAESCTGGLAAKRLTDVPGSSGYFLEGMVTYTNTAKRKRLGVRASTLKKHGAVSEETVREMASGCLKRSGADVAVAISGIAGPGGGTPEKPVGLVHYGIAWRKDAVGEAKAENVVEEEDLRVAACQTCFPSGRELVRLFASHRALDLVRRLVSGLDLKI